MSDEILTTDEVAAYLKIGKLTVYKLVKTGELPGFRVGNSWRFQAVEIEKITKPGPRLCQHHGG